MRLKIAVLAGDGIGPEVTREATNILRAVAELGGHEFLFVPGLIGGIASLLFILLGLALSILCRRIGESDRVVEVKMGRKVPFAVVGIVATNIVGMKGKESLIWRHAGGSRV